MASLDEVTAALSAVSSVDDEIDLERLDAAVRTLPSVAEPLQAVPAALAVFERFPTTDAFGVFWSIVHAVEAISGYERLLLESLRRRPAQFTVLMLNRLLNANVASIEGVDLLALLESIAADSSVPAEVRADASRFIAHQRGTA